MNPPTSIKRQLRRPKNRRRLRKLQLRPLLSTLLVAILGLLTFVTLMPSLTLRLVGLPEPSIPAWGQGIAIYDRNDHLVSTIYGERDQHPIALTKVSANLKNAIIAAEDHDFYAHDGINIVSILRAILVDISSRHMLQGGSTISQQLVKNLYFEGKKRNLGDKIAEAGMALALERRYKKDEILEAYLNCVYFGGGAYGIQRASQHYFGVDASQLDIAQAAFLAALVNAPSELGQPDNLPRAVARQQLVLNSMAEMHFASPEQIARAKHEKLKLLYQVTPGRRYRYYTFEIIQALKRQFGEKDVYSRGLKVYTYLDPAAQRLAERSVSAGIRKAPRGINQGALVSISVNDGGIMAMVGGAGSFENNQWNRALSAHTAGSAFKPFVYLAGLSSGVLQPDTLLDDSPLEIKVPGAPVYRPRNFDGNYLGQITIRKAIALSRNTCAVRVAQQVGPAEIVEVAHEAGISSPLDANLSLALGSSAVTPVEMANAYATLARGGVYIEPTMIRRIEDAAGHVIEDNERQAKRVFDEEPVAELVDALEDVVERGTGTRARLFDRPVAGKTGTSDAAKDIWFIGFTPDTVTAVWGGNDDNKPVPGHVTGGTVMAGIWQDYMRAYYKQHMVAPGEFIQPLHPLLEEPEPIHILPAPAGIFDRLFGPLLAPAPPAPEAGPPPAPAPPRKRGVIRRFLDFLDL